jgi:hypothetical protein
LYCTVKQRSREGKLAQMAAGKKGTKISEKMCLKEMISVNNFIILCSSSGWQGSQLDIVHSLQLGETALEAKRPSEFEGGSQAFIGFGKSSQGSIELVSTQISLTFSKLFKDFESASSSAMIFCFTSGT